MSVQSSDVAKWRVEAPPPATWRHGPRARVPDLLARFRCETCGKPPIRAAWIDDPAGGASGSGYPPKKRVPLRLPAAP